MCLYKHILTSSSLLQIWGCEGSDLFPCIPLYFLVFPCIPLCSLVFLLQIWGCEGSGLFRAFSRHLLHRLHVPEAGQLRGSDERVHITFLSRDTQYRRVLNERELIGVLEGNVSYVVRRVSVFWCLYVFVFVFSLFISIVYLAILWLIFFCDVLLACFIFILLLNIFSFSIIRFPYAVSFLLSLIPLILLSFPSPPPPPPPHPPLPSLGRVQSQDGLPAAASAGPVD